MMLFWLEDREQTVMPHLTKLKTLNLQPTLHPTPTSLKYVLEDYADELNAQPSAIVVDIMLHGIHDLTDIGIENSNTSSGVHTGYIFVDRFLRKTGSPYFRVPVCFLTEREITPELSEEIQYIRERPDSGPVEILKKYSDNDLERFVALIRAWLRL